MCELLASGSSSIRCLAGSSEVGELVLGLCGLVLDILRDWACRLLALALGFQIRLNRTIGNTLGDWVVGNGVGSSRSIYGLSVGNRGVLRHGHCFEVSQGTRSQIVVPPTSLVATTLAAFWIPAAAFCVAGWFFTVSAAEEASIWLSTRLVVDVWE